MLVCNLREYILEHIPAAPPQYFFYWDKIDKVLRTGVFASVTDYYVLNIGSIIDVIQESGKVYLVTKASNAAPSLINKVLLNSTSSDTNNTLVSASVSAGILTVVMFATTAREITTLTFPMQTMTSTSPAVSFTPCFNNYAIAEGTIISQWCDEFTLNQVIATASPSGAVLVVNENSEQCGYAPPGGLFRVTEEKIIEYRGCTLSNPIYLTWKNTLGGWDYWLFQKNQTENLNTESLGSFINDYKNIGEITNPETEVGKAGQPKIVLGAENLSTSEKVGLKQLLLSNKVYILNQDGTVNRQVKVLPGTFLIQETEGDKHSIEFEINDVIINTIKN